MSDVVDCMNTADGMVVYGWKYRACWVCTEEATMSSACVTDVN